MRPVEIVYIIGVIPVFFFCFLLSSSAEARTAVILVDNLNIRSGPSLDYNPIGQANKDDVYPILQEYKNWMEIQLADGTGWVTKDFIKTNDEITRVNTEKKISIPYDRTHLRNGPSTDFDIIYFAEKDEIFNIVSETAEWYQISNDQVTGYVLKDIVDEEEKPTEWNLEDKTIMIDAGHGGHDVGAVGASGTYEKDFAFFTAHYLEKELQSLGANVLLTRPSDHFISLASRASFSNVMETDAFISLHYNSFEEQPSVSGIETYYYYDQNKKLAKFIQQEIIKTTNADDRGVNFGDYFVIRQNFKPAVLIELGFISNVKMEERLKTTAYQKEIVAGIINGLGKYFSK